MRLLFVIGTRPEAIKLAPVIREARARGGGGVETVVVSTGQHREMLVPLFRFFGIEPDLDLDLMEADQSLEGFASKALVGMSEVLSERAPGALVVQGDTTSAMMSALAAYYRQVPVAHVEAGLRTDDIYSPFPEEVNRRIIGQVARWHLAPTGRAAEALRRENLPPPKRRDGVLAVTGNTVIDALFYAREKVSSAPPEGATLKEVTAWREKGGRVLLVTGHRRENFGQGMREVCESLAEAARMHPEALMVYPAHPNPNVQEPVRQILRGIATIRITEPFDYPEFVWLMERADLVVTDSGGVQEEAPALGVPVLVTRETTERPEAVEAGGVLLVGPDRGKLVGEIDRLLGDEEARRSMARARSPYGDGKAAGRCLAAILGEPFEEFGG